MFKKIWLTLLLVVMACTFSYAEKVYLKDGSVVQGQIIEKGSYYIVIKQGKYPRKYFNGQIDRIEEDAADVDVEYLTGGRKGCYHL